MPPGASGGGYQPRTPPRVFIAGTPKHIFRIVNVVEVDFYRCQSIIHVYQTNCHLSPRGIELFLRCQQPIWCRRQSCYLLSSNLAGNRHSDKQRWEMLLSHSYLLTVTSFLKNSLARRSLSRILNLSPQQHPTSLKEPGIKLQVLR